MLLILGSEGDRPYGGLDLPKHSDRFTRREERLSGEAGIPSSSTAEAFFFFCDSSQVEVFEVALVEKVGCEVVFVKSLLDCHDGAMLLVIQPTEQGLVKIVLDSLPFGCVSQRRLPSSCRPV